MLQGTECEVPYQVHYPGNIGSTGIDDLNYTLVITIELNALALDAQRASHKWHATLIAYSSCQRILILAGLVVEMVVTVLETIYFGKIPHNPGSQTYL